MFCLMSVAGFVTQNYFYAERCKNVKIICKNLLFQPRFLEQLVFFFKEMATAVPFVHQYENRKKISRFSLVILQTHCSFCTTQTMIFLNKQHPKRLS